MEAKNFLINSINQNPDCNSYLIGKLFCYAASNDCDELLIDNAKFIDLVNVKQIQKIINILCDYKKYDIIMILSEHTTKIISDMFLKRIHIYDMLDLKDSEFIKKFLTRFPEIVLDDINSISFQLYEYGIDIIDFIIEMCCDKDIVDKYLKNFIEFACKKGDLNILASLLEKYHNRISNYIRGVVNKIYNDVKYPETIGLIFKTYNNIFNDGFYYYFYNKLFEKNDVKMMKYMFDNFDFDYTRRNCLLLHNTKITTLRMILDDTIDKKFFLSKWIANALFIRYCLYNDFDYAYKIKYHYPEIDADNARCGVENTKLSNWLEDGCPITKMTKSANKVV